MEVHRPKHPLHGFRDFLKEVGIIVLGVLLGLAQAVHVGTQVLGDRQARGIIGGAVDGLTGGQPLHRGIQGLVGLLQGVVGEHRREIGVNAQRHDEPPCF